MPLIVPQVCRYTMNGTYAGRPVANVIDMQIDTTGSTMDRPTAIDQQAGVLLNQWKTQLMTIAMPQYVFTSVSWLDLNSSTGSVGSRTTSGATTLPAPGTAAGTPMPGNVAYLIRKMTTAVRGARKGRIYICGVSESATFTTTTNTIEPSQLTTMQTMLTSFFGNVNQTPGTPTTYSGRMVVVQVLTYDPPVPPHTSPSPATGTHHFVTSLQLDSLLATQRRRLRG